MSSRQSLAAVGEASFARSERVSAELLSLTYGSVVRQLLADYESVPEVNKQLDEMGYNVGVRIIDDFLAKSRAPSCGSFNDTADTLAKVAFRMFLGVAAHVTDWDADRTTFTVAFDDNPLSEFAVLPPEHGGLWFSNVLCGVIRGALEMVNMKVDAKFIKCKLRGDETHEIRVALLETLTEKPPKGED